MASSLKRRKKAKALFSNGIMLMIMLFYLLPFWYIVNNAFKAKRYISLKPFYILPEMFTFDNIVNAFQKMNYLVSFKNSLITLILSCVLFVLLGSMTGYAIATSKTKLAKGAYIFFVSLIALPFQAAMVPLVSMMNEMGLSNSYVGLACVYASMFMPFIVFLYTGFMKSLPVELREAAEMDGCNYFQCYAYVYMPLLKTVTGIVLVLRGVYVWNDLQVPLIVINDSSLQTLQQKLYVFSQSRIGNLDLIFAGALIVCLPMVAAFLLMQKSFIKAVMAGSIKG